MTHASVDPASRSRCRFMRSTEIDRCHSEWSVTSTAMRLPPLGCCLPCPVVTVEQFVLPRAVGNFSNDEILRPRVGLCLFLHVRLLLYHFIEIPEQIFLIVLVFVFCDVSGGTGHSRGAIG